MKRWRVAGVSGFWFASTLSATLGALLLATSLQSRPVAGPTLRLGNTQQGPGTTQGRLRFAPLNPKVLSGVPGLAGIEAVLALPTPEPEAEEGTQGTRTARGRAPSPSPSPGPAAEGPAFHIEMTADRTVVRPGDIIGYTIRTRNVGKRRAESRTVLSHIPEHTTYVSGSQCPDGTITERRDGTPGLCTEIPVQPPATGDHGFVDSAGPMDPGEEKTQTFSVQVDADTPDGTEIRNHAHVSAPEAEARTSSDAVTVVRVR